MLAPLPIDDALPSLLSALRHSPSVVLHAPTGAGKTTRVPVALLDAGLAGAGEVVVLEPRRVAARAAARRMADERGERLGETVGYRVRLDSVAGPRTRVLAVTPGVLLRRMLNDPYLERVGAIVFDEFHERGLEADLALGMARLVQESVRPELKLVVMSATLDAVAVSAYLGGCPVVSSTGRSFPVTIRYEPHWPLAEAVAWALRETPGGALVFLPGVGEIRAAAGEARAVADAAGAEILPLYGDLPPEEQDRALSKLPHRKVVLSTNVAETSVTVEGVTAVIDTGTARRLRFDPGSGLDRLELGPIAQDAAEQRAGRAGRTQPGVCVRLWAEANHRQRDAATAPEVARVDLTGAVLQLACLGESDPAAFPWPDAPPAESLAAARRLLERLGAFDAGGLTDLGRAMGDLPTHPRVARMLLAGRDAGAGRRVALAAALLGERDPFLRGTGPPPARRRGVADSDVLDRVAALEQFEATGRGDTAMGTLHRDAARQLFRARDQFARLLDNRRDNAEDSDTAVLRAILAGYPDRVARRRSEQPAKARLVGGRGVSFAPSCGVSAEWLVCVELDGAGPEALARQASAIEPEWLDRRLLNTSDEVTFDESAGRLQARRVRRYDDLTIDETPIPLPKGGATARALAEAAAGHWGRVRPSADSGAGRLLARLAWLRDAMPGVDLPDFGDDALRELLPELCRDRRTLEEVAAADWHGAIAGRLTYAQSQLLDREAPERVRVPAGTEHRLDYEPGRPPVLAVRIQELFGLADTPRIAGGRVRLLLHLLAPNYRPQQVTDDLASFWRNTYPQVRKDLRGRYPKHSWPDDPLAAPPTARGGRRG